MLLSFTPAEVFIVSKVPKGTIRGSHAHLNCSQLLILRFGSIRLNLEDRNGIRNIVLDNPGAYHLINPLTWSSQEFLDQKTEIIVFCSERYSEKDYIRDYSTFVKLIKS